jgi:hypothetical protein
MTVVSPGEMLSIEVATASGIAFRFVTVVGEKSFDASLPLSDAPYRFSIFVPKNLSLGPHYFTAVGHTLSGDMAASLPLAVDVETDAVPLSLKMDPPAIDFEALGEEIPIRVLGEFADGVEMDVTRSSQLHLASTNLAVAMISEEGIVRAVTPGTSRIVSSYQTNAGALHSQIVTTVHEFALRLSARSLEFGSLPQGMESATRTLTLTNPGQSPVEIREVRSTGDYRTGGGCLSAGPLPPGGTCTVAVTFEPSAAGPRLGSVIIATNALSAATVVALSGAGVGR